MTDIPTDSDPVAVCHGDCLEVLRQLPAGVFDAVVTDPPYGQTNERYDGRKAASLRPDVWAECRRACKPDAALVSFAGSPTYHIIASAIEAGGWKVRQMWGWVYRDGMITSAYPRDGFDRLAPAMDPIVFATRGKVLLHAKRVGPEWTRERNTPSAAPCTLSARSSPVRATSGKGHYPRTLASDGSKPFEYFAVPRTGRYRQTDHPNEKPIELMRWLVSKLPGTLVLDPFAGSGTTAVACVAEGRRCLLIEQNAGYCEIARKRVGAAHRREAGSPFATAADPARARETR